MLGALDVSSTQVLNATPRRLEPLDASIIAKGGDALASHDGIPSDVHPHIVQQTPRSKGVLTPIETSTPTAAIETDAISHSIDGGGHREAHSQRKILELTGEVSLLSPKASKLIGDEMTEEQKLAAAAAAVAEEILSHTEKFQAEQAKELVKHHALEYAESHHHHTNAKALEVMGEPALAGKKAAKLIGGDAM